MEEACLKGSSQRTLVHWSLCFLVGSKNKEKQESIRVLLSTRASLLFHSRREKETNPIKDQTAAAKTA